MYQLFPGYPADVVEVLAWKAWQAVQTMQHLVEAELGRRLAADSHLSCQDFNVLTAIEVHPDVSMRIFELVDSLGWEKSRVSHQVRRMTDRGLLHKSPCPDDRRGTRVTPTALAQDAMAEAQPAYVAAVQRLLGETLTTAQLDALADAAAAVIARLEPRPADDDGIDRGGGSAGN